jgi:hypothetical protein
VNACAVQTPSTAGSERAGLIGMFWPLRNITDAWVLRRLMRQMPTTPRLWVPTNLGIRPETDAEFLARLRVRALERSNRATGKPATHIRGATRRPDDR